MKNDKKTTREDVVTRVQGLIKEANRTGVDKKYYDGLLEQVEELKEELLGWEDWAELDWEDWEELVEAVEDKKYYLINPEIENYDVKYLNAEIVDGEIVGIFFLDRSPSPIKSPSPMYQTKFSEADLQIIKSKYPKTFGICDCEKVEVKDINK